VPNALIFSSNFNGHRQVYVFVLAHILSDMGFDLYLAGNFEDDMNDFFYINNLIEKKKITTIDVSIYGGRGLNITFEDILKLQETYKIGLTLFAEADNHIRLFNSQLTENKAKFRGKTVGIFLRTFYSYDKLSILNKLRYLKHLKKNWKSDDRLFHEILLKQFHLLDFAFNLDENFVSKHRYNRWLPDMFQQYAETLLIEENSEQRIWIEKLNRFKEINKSRFVFLYFGAAQFRKGYDMLLKLAVESDSCFIHCGLRNDNEKYEYEVNELRRILNAKNRLMETDLYISDPLTIEHFFKSVTHVILPYRDFYGSSGVMLQALSYGLPVLVAQKGIMGQRVMKNKLGYTYSGNYMSLAEKFKDFKQVSKDHFTEDITKYMQAQSLSLIHISEPTRPY
jgi:glycosyltransferase involved in cell wall biosynthesis